MVIDTTNIKLPFFRWCKSNGVYGEGLFMITAKSCDTLKMVFDLINTDEGEEDVECPYESLLIIGHSHNRGHPGVRSNSYGPTNYERYRDKKYFYLSEKEIKNGRQPTEDELFQADKLMQRWNDRVLVEDI